MSVYFFKACLKLFPLKKNPVDYRKHSYQRKVLDVSIERYFLLRLFFFFHQDVNKVSLLKIFLAFTELKKKPPTITDLKTIQQKTPSKTIACIWMHAFFHILFWSSFSTFIFSVLHCYHSSIQILGRTKQNNYSQMGSKIFQDLIPNLHGIRCSCWRGFCAQKALQPPLLSLTEIMNQSPQLLQFTGRDIRVNWNQ